jgi:hypothetical protein
VFRVGIIVVLSSVGLTGCISIVDRQAPVPKDGVIAVLTPGRPKHLTFGNYADATIFVPIYGLAKLMQATAAEPRISAQPGARGFRIEQELQLALVRDMRAWAPEWHPSRKRRRLCLAR